ncbi:MAG: hypothetical protein IMY70_02190, partial [Bacteroidetes bacterium]|nr:hypothetical protein [Bacteroidota bacterium]
PPYNHVTDLYYCEYTGDLFPECYYGRFSANNLTELQPQIDKTLEYEQYLMPDPSFLDEVVMVAGADASHATTWGNGQINYGTTYYFNAAHGLLSHTYLQPEPGGGNYSANIRQNVSDGVAYANYTAHCSTSGWANPSFLTSHISALENAHKYCLMVGNCCSSLEFQTTCFGEEVLRAVDKGALGYIGGSNSTYWDEDYWWGVGYEAISANPVYNAGNLGSYDRTFHDNGEPLNEWFVTQGQMPSAGNLAVTQAGSSRETYYWEIYHLMGDPSLMIYMSQPPATNATYTSLMPLGSATFTVNTEPYAYVGITKDGLLHGAGIANAAGFVDITMNPPITIPGIADIVVTRQNGQPFIGTVTVASPSGPYLTLESFSIDDITGNNNGEADYNEDIALDVILENLGNTLATNVSATLSSSDPYVTITDNIQTWDDIPAGSISTQTGAFEITISNDVPDQHLTEFDLEMTNGSEIWNSSLNIIIQAPFLEPGTMTIDDAIGGNGNGKLDPGETADLIIETSNTGNSDSPDANATLACTSPYITINNTDYNIGSIATGATEYAVFNISVDGSTPIGTSVNFDYDVVAGNYSATDSYYEVIGQIPVLILDLDDNTSSGPAMGIAMTNLGVPYDYAISFPTDINLYSSVFVCLGIYSNNHVLSATEGQALANYLNSGGMIYMEGGDTWAYDSQTAVHSMFNIDGVADGTSDMGTVLGQAGTFTQGMTFNYTGENSWMDHINPIAPVVQIFMNQSPSYGCGVAYDAVTYKTIGTSYEFGGLNDGSSPSTKEELMYQYLDFFGLIPPEVYTVDLTVFLEGPFNETEMETNLNLLGLIPNEQPYGSNPWYYSGSENVVSIPNNDIVDWILVEFRDAPGDASTATSATTFEYQAAFLLKDGSIVGIDGYTDLILNNQVNNNLFAVIHHRNHIPIMSSGPIPLSGNLYEYDFTGSETTVYGGATGYVEIAPGIWGMVSGDGLCDGVINMDDKIVVWEIEAGISGYHSGDFNMNGNVDNKDKNDNWKPNIGKSINIPN